MSSPNTFKIPLAGQDPANLLAKAKSAAASSGAIFVGDATEGVFQNPEVAGSYEVSGSNVYITITIKPWYAPWSMVISRIKKFFESSSVLHETAYEDRDPKNYDQEGKKY
jgi:hypothetical protein